MNVRWNGTLAVTGGSGEVHLWVKMNFARSGAAGTTESVSCGFTLPGITTTAIAGGSKSLFDIPETAWDSPNLPRYTGSVSQVGSTLTVDSAPELVGLGLSDASATWPTAAAIMGVDSDGDGSVGITSVPRDGGGYQPPPTSLAQTDYADRLYLAYRNVIKLSAEVTDCPDSYAGTAVLSAFDNHVIGCRIKGGGDCDASQAAFVDDNRTIYEIERATFESKVIPESADCAAVRAAVPTL